MTLSASASYIEWLSAPDGPATGIDEHKRRLLNMLHFDLWSSDESRTTLDESLRRLLGSEHCRTSFRQLLAILGAKASHLIADAGLPVEVPLKLARSLYTQRDTGSIRRGNSREAAAMAGGRAVG